MLTPDEIFDYVEQATNKVYDDPSFPNGYSTDEEKEFIYKSIASALLESEYENHFLDDMNASGFEAAFDMMENENFHSEGAALALVADHIGIDHPYIPQVKSYAGFLWD